MDSPIALFLLGLLGLALVGIAALDWKSRIIPNRVNLAIALGAIPFWWASGLSLWPDIAVQLGLAALVLGLFWIVFAIGGMGGGDVKLLAALALWLPPQLVFTLLVIMSLAGGALTFAMWIRHRVARREERLEIPYGVAIAFGGICLISERFLNQFG